LRSGSKFLLALCCALTASCCATAGAAASRPFEYSSSFAEPCTAAEPSECTGAALKKPNGVAVNEATGDVYVVDEGANRVVRFDEKGVFQSEFNGSGLIAGEGTAAGFGGQTGEVETGTFNKPQTIAVDNSCFQLKLSEPQCKAQDPSNGDVYVVDAGNEVIDKYSADGEYVGQITEEGKGERATYGLTGVAVDAKGRVWVWQESNEISQFTNESQNAFVGKVDPSGIPTAAAPGIALDSAGNFYLRYGTRSRIAKVSPQGTPITLEMDNQESSAVAVDLSNGDVLIDNLTSVAVFGPEGGEPIERLGQENGAEHLGEGAGIGVDGSLGVFYVADAAAGKVIVFGPQKPSAPKIEGESFSEVGSQRVSLAAQINPHSEPGEEPTEYSFQYGRCASTFSCAEDGYEAAVPAPPGQIEADFNVHTVSVPLTGLQPNTTYHFRALARNSHGEAAPGQELNFTTQGEGGAPALPDGRGWELVSPPNKLGALIEPISEAGVIQAAASGDAITYLTNSPTEAQPQGSANKSQVLSRRRSSSWSSRDIAISHTSATGHALGPGPEYKFFDPELNLSAVQPFGEFNPLLSEEASESTAYLHELSESCAGSCFQPLVSGKPGFANVPPGTQFGEEQACKPKETGTATKVFCGPAFLGASEDLAHIVLSSLTALTPGGPAPGLYEWNQGRLSPVSVLPDETTVAGDLGGFASEAARGAIAKDGSLVVWTSPSPSALYDRDIAAEKTIQLDQAEEVAGSPCGGCESGGGIFQLASADGSRVLFSDFHKLTGDSGASPSPGKEKADLYECQIVPEPTPHCVLSDLTPKRVQGAEEEGAGVLGRVLGASEDGSYLYFVAEGVQSGANAQGESPKAKAPNLYLRHDGVTSFITTLAAGDDHDWSEESGVLEGPARQPTRVSPDGRYLALMSEAQLTSYDNRDAAGAPTAEVYLYDAATGKLICPSCDPSGARPEGVEYHKLEPGSGGLVGGPRGIWPVHALVAANVPGWTAITTSPPRARHQPRYLTDEGRLFFNTVNALQPKDHNGTQDVYEYEPPTIRGPQGEAPCSEGAETYTPRAEGCVSLISSGSSAQESAFLDASESGDDVFFLTAARLSAIDTDNAFDIYDAHVCTGEEPCITYTPQQESSCQSESACKAPLAPQPSIFGAPASQTFTGPANPTSTPPPAAKVKSAEEVRIEKLNKALKACRSKKSAKRRKACEATARKRYAKPAKKKPKKKTKKGKKK
jgi:DNA-binding beta-propeller fold protein YncE